MKLAGSLTLVLALTALGCHHDKAVTTTPTVTAEAPPAAPPPSAPPAAPAPVTADQKMSHTLALSGELVQICGIRATESAVNPKFDFDKDELTADDRNVLQQVATCMTTGPLKGRTVSLTGRADPRGTEEYNLALGSRRASSVSQYLQRLGVAAARLPQVTRGALDATGADPSGWAADRRVDIQVSQT